jgi:hypothetical protein
MLTSRPGLGLPMGWRKKATSLHRSAPQTLLGQPRGGLVTPGLPTLKHLQLGSRQAEALPLPGGESPVNMASCTCMCWEGWGRGGPWGTTMEPMHAGTCLLDGAEVNLEVVLSIFRTPCGEQALLDSFIYCVATSWFHGHTF